jgi:hypothetical protein
MKLDELLSDLTKKNVLGKVLACKFIIVNAHNILYNIILSTSIAH